MTFRRRGLTSGYAVLLLAPYMTLACGDEAASEADAAGMVSDVVTDALGDGCATQSIVSAERDIDILFVVATSASMATIDGDASRGSRWLSAESAIRTFVAAQSDRHFGAGMLFFPVLVPAGDGGSFIEACSASDYLLAAVRIAPLEANGDQAAAFTAALDSRLLEGGNAMAAALAGALRQAARAKSTTGHVIQTVLVTDGALDPCGASVADTAAVAGDAFDRDHLETYVLGIGPDANSLDPIAAAGGTFHTYAALGDDAVAAALATMGRAMRRCHFFFPMVLSPDGFSRVSMVIDNGTSGVERLSRVADGGSCQQNQGWFYNSEAAPAYALFCPATCDALLQREDREVEALLGCF